MGDDLRSREARVEWWRKCGAAPQLAESLAKLEEAGSCDACQEQINELKERLGDLESAQAEKSPRELDPLGVAHAMLRIEQRLGKLERARAESSTAEHLQERRVRIGCIRAMECTCYVCQAERRELAERDSAGLLVTLSKSVADKLPEAAVALHLPEASDAEIICAALDIARHTRQPTGTKRCPRCGDLANLHFRGSECLGCDRCRSSNKPDASPSPVEEQPAVEIDMAAVEELLREQDAKRRGPSQ